MPQWKTSAKLHQRMYEKDKNTAQERQKFCGHRVLASIMEKLLKANVV
jgi:hypothetical protein